MKKWYTLFRIENPNTDWRHKVWCFEQLSRKELHQKRTEGWRVSGDGRGETVARVADHEKNKNGIRCEKSRKG